MYANMQVGELFVTINLLKYKDSDIPHATKGKMLGYVQSFSTTYALNAIPVANVTIPLGSTLNQDGSTSPSYAYGGSADSIYKLGDDSTPVGIYVRGAFFDTMGGSSVQEFCVFKGYVTDSVYERTAESAVMSIKLIHWLCHLTEFPLVSSLLAPQTPADIAAQCPLMVSLKAASELVMTRALGYQDLPPVFSPVAAALSALQGIDPNGGKKKVDDSIWGALKTLFTALNFRTDRLKKTDPGYVSKPYLERVEGALKAVVGSDLDFFSKDKTAYGFIKPHIAQYLASLSIGYFSGSTIWSKLVDNFLPNFYMAITPRVCEANVIPAPGQGMASSKAIRISRSEYYRTSYSRISFPTLFGGVMLYLDPNVHVGVNAQNPFSFRFPEQLQPGPLQIVTAPPWLQNKAIQAIGSSVKNGQDFYRQYEAEVSSRKIKKREEKAAENTEGEIIANILRNLTKTSFQVMAFADRQVSISMPIRVDLTAGELVCIELPSGVVEATQEYIYGTIDSVTLTIGPGTANTTIVLSNIRTLKEMKNKDLTSEEGVLFSKVWKTNKNLILCEPVK